MSSVHSTLCRDLQINRTWTVSFVALFYIPNLYSFNCFVPRCRTVPLHSPGVFGVSHKCQLLGQILSRSHQWPIRSQSTFLPALALLPEQWSHRRGLSGHVLLRRANANVQVPGLRQLPNWFCGGDLSHRWFSTQTSSHKLRPIRGLHKWIPEGHKLRTWTKLGCNSTAMWPAR